MTKNELAKKLEDLNQVVMCHAKILGEHTDKIGKIEEREQERRVMRLGAKEAAKEPLSKKCSTCAYQYPVRSDVCNECIIAGAPSQWAPKRFGSMTASQAAKAQTIQRIENALKTIECEVMRLHRESK